MDRGGMEIDAEVAAPDDLGQQNVGEAGRERARCRSGNDRFRSRRSGR